MTQPQSKVNPFKPATKEKLHLRMALSGAAGSGKTWTSLLEMALLLGGVETAGKGATLSRRENGLAQIAFIDTERGSARKYGADFPSDVSGQAIFDVLEINRNDQGAIDPQEMTNAVMAAAEYGYAGIVVDSFSHAWEGILDVKERKDKAAGSAVNKFTGWRDVNPIHAKLLESILSYPGHVIVTMRVKTDNVIEKNETTGKNEVRKMGLKAIQREGVEFEFDIIGDMSNEHGINRITFSKCRCSALNNMIAIDNPSREMAQTLIYWLDSGEAAQPPMTKDEFVDAVIALGIAKDKIGATLQEKGLLTIGGRDKYRDQLDALTNLLKSAA